jgi:hypothetical protein
MGTVKLQFWQRWLSPGWLYIGAALSKGVRGAGALKRPLPSMVGVNFHNQKHNYCVVLYSYLT